MLDNIAYWVPYVGKMVRGKNLPAARVICGLLLHSHCICNLKFWVYLTLLAQREVLYVTGMAKNDLSPSSNLYLRQRDDSYDSKHGGAPPQLLGNKRCR